MNLHRLLQRRLADGRPVRVGLIGAGKFGSMFLNQVPTMHGLDVSVIADLDPERARTACQAVGWDAARISQTAFVASGAEACADSHESASTTVDRQRARGHRPRHREPTDAVAKLSNDDRRADILEEELRRQIQRVAVAQHPVAGAIGDERAEAVRRVRHGRR